LAERVGARFARRADRPVGMDERDLLPLLRFLGSAQVAPGADSLALVRGEAGRLSDPRLGILGVAQLVHQLGLQALAGSQPALVEEGWQRVGRLAAAAGHLA